MEQLSSKPILNNVVEFDADTFATNSRYLWIWNPTEIPPHMGISIKNYYFSLKANGVDLDYDLSDLTELISRKGIPVVAVEVFSDFTLEDCHAIFSKFEQTIAHEITCLNPIKDLLQLNKPAKLLELLLELVKNEQIGKKISWNIIGSTISLPDYSIEDIHAHIVALSK